MIKCTKILAMTCAAVLALSGCKEGADSQVSSKMVSLEHVRGTTQIPEHPQKVIIFDMALLDTLDLLGVEVAGVPQASTSFPKNIAKYKDPKYINAGTLFEPNFENISNANPDLIIGSGRAEKAFSELEKIAPTIDLSLDNSHFLESLKARAQTAGKIFGKEAQAAKQIELLDQSIEKTKEKSSQAGTALVLMISGGKISAYGPGSRFGFVFDSLSFKPAANFPSEGRHGNVVSPEFILETNPDWIFVIDRDTAIGESEANAAAKKVLDNQLINKTKAQENNHIIYLDSPALYIAGGLRTYQELVKQIDEVLSK
ncbi:siderophore ABC transporter substrate-binding protein [Neisseria sp. Ec49-e6-T10]|uniref:siderophore ABC transporter substrate-binding protein n=1 Tax=Neisseria sp. Ec49-e6-T10 TaxID=3140744 RepID=UPI003EB885B9